MNRIESHRLSAFFNGILAGVGLVLIVWSLSSITSLALEEITIYIGLIFIGVIMFAVGGVREAYIWGKFSMKINSQYQAVNQRSTHPKTQKNPTYNQSSQTLNLGHKPLVSEQIRMPTDEENQRTTTN